MPKPKPESKPESKTVQKIAEALGESDPIPLKTIERLVSVIGDERAIELLNETQKIEAEGGLKTDDGKRRRTPGGVFFKLAKNQLTDQERWRVFTPKTNKPKQPIPPPTLADLAPLIREVLTTEKGEATTVKLTIIGKPGRIIEKERVVLTSLQSSNPPSLPKGLPQPPTEPTIYLVYISKKQWNKVKDSIDSNTNDKLIIEGYPVFDKRIGKSGTMSIYAQNVTTKFIQQAKREQQQAEAETEAEAE